MKPPLDANRRLLILILRALGKSQDDVRQMVACGKKSVKNTRIWFVNGLTYDEASAICTNEAIRDIIQREHLIFKSEKKAQEFYDRAKSITADDILRHYREEDYIQRHSMDYEHLHEQETATAGDRYYLDEETGKIKRRKYIKDSSDNGKLLA